MWILGLLILGIGLSILLPSFVGGAWSPTPMPVVHKMLEYARLQPGETLYDLGAGDGRVIMTAGGLPGVRAIGVEIDPLRWALCKWRARGRANIQVLRENMFHLDLRDADVVTFYLSQGAADLLQEKLQAELGPGARVISNRRPIPGWQPQLVDEEFGLYVYVMEEQGKGNKS
jgi:hypothetical protein